MQLITLSGNPLSTNNIYRHRGNITYMTRKGREMKNSYQWEAKTQWQGFKCLTGALEIWISLHFKDKRVYDIDNFGKLLLDSLTGIVWNDDRQIQKMTVEKFYDKEKPRIEIKILELTLLK